VRFHRVQVLDQWPHSGRGFTQGLIADGNTLWESTGGQRTSSLRRYWLGMCTAGDHVVTSDGSSELVRRDPGTLKQLEVIPVRYKGRRIHGINDLAWADGRVWANLFWRSRLIGIDLEDGRVTDVVDARAVRERRSPTYQTERIRMPTEYSCRILRR
jgi:glutamine cyclotransferase